MEKSSIAVFHSRDYAPADRLSAFQEMTASVYDAQALGNESGFMVETYGFQVNQLMFHDFKCSNARFRRKQRHLQGEEKDFLVLHAQLSGEELLQMEHGIIRLLPGNIYLRDWAFPFDSQTSEMHIRGVMIPRNFISYNKLFSEHNPILSWPLSAPKGALLWTLWSQLFDDLSNVDIGTAEILAQGFLGFLNGLVTVVDQTQEPGHSRLRSMEQHLKTQLRGDVSVEDLCKYFHVSRATVFRLFKNHGGLKHYVDRLRLERCYSELRSADPGRTTIGEVAAGWGYNDPRAFNRRFRTQFGMAPSKVHGIGFEPEQTIQISEATTAEYNNYFRNFKRWLADASGSDEPDE